MRKLILILIIFLNLFLVNSTNYDAGGGVQFTDDGGNIKVCSSCGWNFIGSSNSYEYYPGIRNWLTSTTCTPSISATTISANFNYPFPSIQGTAYNYLVFNSMNTVLENNLYMKTRIEYVLYRDGSQVAVSTNNIQVIVPPAGTTYSLPIPVEFTQPNVEITYGAGSYVVKSKATPIDGKCPSVVSGYSSPISSFIIEVPIVPLPVITSFTANPGATIIEGQPLYFNWESTNALSCELKKGGTQLISATSKLGYSVTALPSPGSSAVYRLICSNHVGDTTFQDITITVNPMTYFWQASSWGTCQDTSCNADTITNIVYGTSLRTVSCKNSLNEVVLDSFCEILDKPVNTQSCSISCDFDNDLLENGYDLCKNVKWNIEGHTATSKEQYQGCPYEYTSNGCSGSASYTGTNLICNYYDCFFCDNNNYFSFNGNKVSDSAENIYYKPNQGSGQYICYNHDSGSDSEVGYCNLGLNVNPDAYCTIDGRTDILKIGEKKKYYKYKKILKKEKESDDLSLLIGYSISYNSQECTIGGTILSAIPTEYSYGNSFILSGPEYDNLIRDTITGELKINDDITVGKLSCDSTNDLCSLQTTPITTVEVNLAQIPQVKTAAIKIIKDGENIRNDTIDISLIAMQAHKIQRFTSDEAATNFIAKSYAVMTNFNITKNLTYNSVTNKTTVRIQMNNIEPADQVNLTLYMIVDKTIANSLEDISNIEKGNAQVFVVDKDPIIGWYFNESGSDEEVGYEVPGDTEGGTIIITQTPILYNEGELIINYRETDCSADELTLFELDDLIDSKVYAPGSSQLYKVCLTHLDSNVNLALGSGVQSIDVMSYRASENASSNPNELTTKITLSTDNSSLYWDVRVQKENPSGNYSCIGSLDKINKSSLFGDCGYNEDARVWIHLGEDYNAPETTLSYPGLAHTLKVTLTAFEPTWESGVKNLSYRVLEDNEPFTTVEDDTISFMVTCPNDWNCKKTVEYYAYDTAGNKEENKTRELLLIDKGSACQSDCTAKPSPNRYLKECTNLNSCQFYQFNQFGINDGGDYVANQCDYLAIGSWATYNETHEVLCPKGPFRESKFTNTRVNIIDESNCENVLKTPYSCNF